MFGTATSTSNKDNGNTTRAQSVPSKSQPDGGLTVPESGDNYVVEKRHSISVSPSAKKKDDQAHSAGDKKRRSSGVSKASALLSSAKNSLHLSGSSNSSGDGPIQTPIQKLGKKDPALSVPQGSLNNSAGESFPGPRSTFRVGVTEDKNKKCRRTMEDTHAYLYNFLSTPAPVVGSPSSSPPNKSAISDRSNSDSSASGSSSQVVETDNGYFAIFDGHAGTFAADWCGKKLHLLLEDCIRRNPNTPVPELLDQTFTMVDHQLERLPLKNSGCTAVVAVLRWEDRIPNSHSATGSMALAPATAAALRSSSGEGLAADSSSLAAQSQTNVSGTAGDDSKSSNLATPVAHLRLQESASRQRVLYTANVGDARIVLCRNGKALRLSYDHKGSDDNEGKRIANAGGLILNNRVNGVLAVTRALGDSYMKDLVTGHPYTTETVVQPDIDEFLILACDGLWDVCSDQEAVDLIRHTADPQAASKQLVDHALSRFSTDNLSCMVIRFDSKAVQGTVERKIEPIGVEGDPSSTKDGGISEADAIVAEAKKQVQESGSELENVTTQSIVEESEGESGPELTPTETDSNQKQLGSNC
ncbi:protein serine/threonine phosphatase 2C [Xylona heveae TC161]|uniref:Protein serine/threonine phosphatase 2C n=1 Tax=Xylona heveae (strain CBS 132557 / TC161) TaxID=1328760 RepID=A0A165JWV4_XYLHT|nr:protein serine/threonine phosphatase 2C [Xylona heveae TC161]KZF26724.1 protein serine/threonine phosphatase 2C [Xylona heveae TC161]